MSEDPLAEQKEASKKKVHKRGREKGSKKPVIVLDISGLPIVELIKDLFDNALCLYGLANDKSLYPQILTSQEIEKFISEGKELHIVHGRHLGGLSIVMRKLNASMYNKYNCECLEAQDSDKEVKKAEEIIEGLRGKQQKKEKQES